MEIVGQKGLRKLKIRIHRMKNNTLISEWQAIRLINSDCIPQDISNCTACNYARCLCFLTYEEVITSELLNRGLFDYAINNCMRYKTTHIYDS